MSAIPKSYRAMFEAATKGKDHGGQVQGCEFCPVCGSIVVSWTRQAGAGESPGFVLVEPSSKAPDCADCRRMVTAYPEVANWVMRVVGHHNGWLHSEVVAEASSDVGPKQKPEALPLKKNGDAGRGRVGRAT